jgi:biopolymer transport protein ExbD
VDEGPRLEVDKNQMSIDGLVPYVAERLKQNPEKPIILRTDPSASYGNMIAVFDELRRAEEDFGTKMNISIPTQREIENIWTLLGIG